MTPGVLALVAGFFGLAILPGACAAAATATGSGAAAINATDDNFYNDRYQPFELTIAPGETILVRDTGKDQHTLTSVDKAWPQLALAAGQQGNVTAPSSPGDYRFYCIYHSSSTAAPGEGMAGVLHVRAAGPNATTTPTPSPTKPLPSPPFLALAGVAIASLLAGRLARRRP